MEDIMMKFSAVKIAAFLIILGPDVHRKQAGPPGNTMKTGALYPVSMLRITLSE
jgi:hypothetical protein